MDWTHDVIERLRTLWAEGHATAEIGRRLGVSKNTIIGKARRLDLIARPSPIRRRPLGETGIEQTGGPCVPRLADLAPMPVYAAIAPGQAVRGPVTLAKPKPKPVARPRRTVVRESCCWPIGEPGLRSFRFCDGAALAGKPYCEEHACLAYRPKLMRDGRAQASG